MHKQELETLLEKYITGELDPMERARLAQLVEQPGQQETLEGFVHQVMMSDEFAGHENGRVKEAIMAQLEKRMTEKTSGGRLFFIRWAAAAAVVILLAGGAWVCRSGRTEMPAPV